MPSLEAGEIRLLSCVIDYKYVQFFSYTIIYNCLLSIKG